MIKKYLSSLKDAFFSVIPLVLIISLVSYLIHVPILNIYSFLISSFLLIIGISLFTFGAELSMVVIGEKIGDKLIQSKGLWFILLVALFIGIAVTLAEPDLMVLSNQLTSMPNLLIIILVALGVGIFLMIAVFRIIKGLSFRTILIVSYGIIGIMLIFCPSNFITIAFDASGVTTGPMSVPFIVALGYGLTKLRSDQNAKSDTFGIIGLCSIGPIIMILLLSLFFKTDSVYDVSPFYSNNLMLFEYFDSFCQNIREVAIALIPILLIFTIFEFITNMLKNQELKKVILGILASFAGLSIFLTGVNVGFIKMGFSLGNIITMSSNKYLLIPLGMLLGYIIVMVEPAVKVLNEQISDLTGGSISKKMVSLSLSVGVCLAIGLSLLRVFFNIPFVYFIVPGYIITIFLSFKTPKIFTAIAFDSGGAASGPLTTSFLLPICIGACIALDGDILSNAFGVVALVSMTPLITVQLLGIIYQYKLNKSSPRYNLDESIIDYVWEA